MYMYHIKLNKWLGNALYFQETNQYGPLNLVHISLPKHGLHTHIWTSSRKGIIKPYKCSILEIWNKTY